MLTQHNKLLARSHKRVNIAAAFATVAMLFSTPTFASEIQDREIKVRFKKVELTSENGVQTVYKKFQRKAKKACKFRSVTPEGDVMTKEACIEDLVSQFVSDANIPVLTVYHNEAKTKVG
ncbi:MAG: UrcA family protein [Hyphomonadaceae bacterium]|nr:UrcA family protein [Hyphomonadaceae bacterium]